MIGIYKITNKLNNKCYIGQSIDIEQRWKQHRMYYASNHCSTNDWHYDLFYNPQNYDFSIVEECSMEELNIKEKYWIEYYDSYNNGLNKTKGGDYIRNSNKIYVKDKYDYNNCFMLKWEDYCQAARELSPSALNLYMYLAKNKDGYEFFFSSKDYCNTFNVVDKTFRNAKNELINKGYLKEGEKNKVHFSSKGAFKETKESLKEELTALVSRIKIENNDIYEEFILKVADAKLPEIENEYVYKNEIKKLISFAEELLAEFSKKEIENLL